MLDNTLTSSFLFIIPFIFLFIATAISLHSLSKIIFSVQNLNIVPIYFSVPLHNMFGNSWHITCFVYCVSFMFFYLSAQLSTRFCNIKFTATIELNCNLWIELNWMNFIFALIVVFSCTKFCKDFLLVCLLLHISLVFQCGPLLNTSNK